MTATSAPPVFGEVSAVAESGPGRYTAELDPLWTFDGKPNGGYLQAVLARAALAATSRKHVIAASTHYLHSPRPGRVHIDIEVLRESASTSQVRARLTADGEPAVEALFSLGVLASAAVASEWESPALPPPGLGIDECIRHAPPREVIPVEIMHQIDLRLEPDSMEFFQGRPRGLGELRGWLTLPGHEHFDTVSLLLAGDVMPPATFDISLTGWVPTFTMATYIRALPAPGPVQLVIKANLVQGGRVDETCTVRDSRGLIVAQSNQLAGVRLT